MYLNNLFIYGTLLPGLTNYKRFIEPYKSKTFQARAKGTMYHLPDDGYPVVLAGEGQVKGVLYETRDLHIILPEVDEIEKFTGVESQNLLIREIVDVENLDTGETVKAHMYLWPPEQAQWLKENAEVVADADWARFLKEKEGNR